MRRFFTACLLLLVSIANAQTQPTYQKKWLIQKQDTLPYRVLYPQDFNVKKIYPVFIFLHGSGERGNDNEAQLIHGSSLFLRDSIRTNYPAIVIFPQCPSNSYWSNVDIDTDSTGQRVFTYLTDGRPTVAMDMLLKLIKRLRKQSFVQRDRIYVSGLSMGGMGVFELVRRKPRWFAAAAPICGGADPATAKKLTRTPWRIFHGMKDNVVNPQFSIAMAEAIKNAGGQAELITYPQANHNSWTPAFAEPDFLQWFFVRHRK